MACPQGPDERDEGGEKTAGYAPDFIPLPCTRQMWTTWRDVTKASIQSTEQRLRLGQGKRDMGKEATTEAPGTLTAEQEPGNSRSQRAKWV